VSCAATNGEDGDQTLRAPGRRRSRCTPGERMPSGLMVVSGAGSAVPLAPGAAGLRLVALSRAASSRRATNSSNPVVITSSSSARRCRGSELIRDLGGPAQDRPFPAINWRNAGGRSELGHHREQSIRRAGGIRSGRTCHSCFFSWRGRHRATCFARTLLQQDHKGCSVRLCDSTAAELPDRRWSLLAIPPRWSAACTSLAGMSL
jgi:hypothetical protein